MHALTIVSQTAVGRFLHAHFAAYRQRAKWPFLWRISLEGLIVPLVISSALTLLFHLPQRTDLERLSSWKLFVSAVVIAPFIETLIFQSFPVAVARAVGWGFWSQVAVSNLLFALAHFGVSASTGIGAGLFSGFYIAFTYVHWRQTSFRAGLWMTTGMHALHNFVLIGIVLIDRALD
jgi:hypothetical protein